MFKLESNAIDFIAENKPMFSKKQILDAQEEYLTLGSNNLIIIDKSKLGI